MQTVTRTPRSKDEVAALLNAVDLDSTLTWFDGEQTITFTRGGFEHTLILENNPTPRIGTVYMLLDSVWNHRKGLGEGVIDKDAPRTFGGNKTELLGYLEQGVDPTGQDPKLGAFTVRPSTLGRMPHLTKLVYNTEWKRYYQDGIDSICLPPRKDGYTADDLEADTVYHYRTYDGDDELSGYVLFDGQAFHAFTGGGAARNARDYVQNQ